MKALTIVVYHYVRDVHLSVHRGIKAISSSAFAEQLDHIRSRYTVIGPAALHAALRDGERLPDNAAMLTFDDGYIDHFSVALPMLFERRMSAFFFPPVRPVREHKVLDVNKIHFILSSVPDTGTLIDAIGTWVRAHADEYGLDSMERYWTEWAKPNRFDGADTIFIKRMLQRALPESGRSALTHNLFERFVTTDETAFACELYMSMDQLRMMSQLGMGIGNHGWSHSWLDSLGQAEQEWEIDQGLAFLEEIGGSPQSWIMCYPYGGWNAGLLEVLRQRNCLCGLTVRSDIADLQKDDPMLLPRIDTNELPPRSRA